jgi:hypothetical protein
MKARITLVAVFALVPLLVLGRLVQVPDLKKLIADSNLVFVGRVTSVTPSNIRTSLSYVPFSGVTFQWQEVEVTVLEAVKGCKKGHVVHSLMLSVDKKSQAQPRYSPPGMLKPEKGDIFFLCLGPSSNTNWFAAMSAPYDENLSVFVLHRSQAKKQDNQDVMKETILSVNNRFALICSVVNESGEIMPTNVEKLRRTYATEIGTPPSNRTIYLEWETYTNANGWMSDVPKGYASRSNTNRK